MVSLLNYYFKLFSDRDRDSFERNELIDFQRIIPKEVVGIFEHDGNFQDAMIAFSVSALFTYFWTLMGFLIGESHYSNEFSSYFFHFPIFPILFLFGLPYLQNFLYDLGEDNILYKLSLQNTGFVIGSSISVIAANLASYGAYHEMLFVLIFLNTILSTAISLYKLKERHESEHTFSEEEDLEGSVQFDDDFGDEFS